MLRFNRNVDNKFEFDMQITGESDSSDAPNVYYVCKTSECNYAFESTHTGNGHYTVKIPAYAMAVGTHKSAIWVHMGDRFYKPHEMDVEFYEPVTPKISNFSAGEVKPKEPTISFNTSPAEPTITMTTPTPAVAEAHADMWAIIKSSIDDEILNDPKLARLAKFFANNLFTDGINPMKTLERMAKSSRKAGIELAKSLINKQAAHDYKNDEIEVVFDSVIAAANGGTEYEWMAEEVKPPPKEAQAFDKLLKKRKT